jgi:lipopolysaccharide biosynthesis glycosyltransferase
VKRLIYQVYLGRDSNTKLYNYCINSVMDYCKLHGFDHKVQRTPILMIKPDLFSTNRNKNAWEEHGGFLPIYEKQNVFNYLDEYDQVCVIDGDIWIRPDTPSVFDNVDMTFDFGAVFEREIPLDPKYKKRMTDYSKNLLGQIPEYNWDYNPAGEFFNSGVLVYNSENIKKSLNGDTPKEFVRRPEFKPFIDGDGYFKWQGDQIMLNYWWKRDNLSVKHLDLKWNTLFNPKWGGTLSEKAKEGNFIHFFQSRQLAELKDYPEKLVELVT